MSILTLITDFGDNDFYLALLKAKIINQLPEYNLIEVSNSQNKKQKIGITELLINNLDDFDASTVHLILIDTEYDKSPTLIIFKLKSQYIITANNTYLSRYYVDNQAYIIYEGVSNYKKIFDSIISTIKLIKTNNSFDSLKTIESSVVINKIREARLTENIISTTVFYIDNYGNFYCNLKENTFESVRKQRSYNIILGRSSINKINRSIGDNDYGKLMAFFNTLGYLEISIGGGDASKLFGIDIGNVVNIRFLD